MVTQKGSKRVNVAETPAGREHLLRVLRDQAGVFFDLVIDASDANWHAATPCEGWEVRDVVGHMAHGAETYLEQYAIALEGRRAAEPLGLRGFAQDLFDAALTFRNVPQAELVHRLKTGWDRLNQVWDGLTDEHWAGLNIPHRYVGPVPQFMMVVFQHWTTPSTVGTSNKLWGNPASSALKPPVPWCLLW